MKLFELLSNRLSTESVTGVSRPAPKGNQGGFDVVDYLISLIPAPTPQVSQNPLAGPPEPSQVVVTLLMMVMVLGGLLLAWMYLRDFSFFGPSQEQQRSRTQKRKASKGSWFTNFFAWLGWFGSALSVFKADGPFQPKPILTPNEIEFYNRLVSALPGYVVLSQVAMSAIIEPRTDDPKEYMRRRMKFAQKFVDFIVCEPGDLRIICIVELDDITHDVEKDALRDEMLGSAGYTVVRWHSRKKPDRAAIAKAIRKLDQAKV